MARSPIKRNLWTRPNAAGKRRGSTRGEDEDDAVRYTREGSAIDRTLVIGLAGASWNVLDPLLETGELPNLARLRADGASGVLESTVPFYTVPAWASYATGCSPAAHGVHDFMLPRPDGGPEVATQHDLRRRAYYQQLGAEGRRSVLINLPLDHYGCENTVVVNSWMTEDEGRRILPFGRRSRYERLLQAYRAVPSSVESVDDLCELEQARFDLARELFLAEPWDHFFVLFSSSDWAGHGLTGRFLHGDQAAREQLCRLYRQLDRHVGWLVDHADGATVAVLSEHGQCEEVAVLRVNSLLRKLGLLAPQQTAGKESSTLGVGPRGRRRLRLSPTVSRYRTNRVLRPMGLAAKTMIERGLNIDVIPAVPEVDHSRSSVFMPTDSSFGLYAVDVDGGHVQDARDALERYALPWGRPAFDGVWTLDELHGRPAGDDGPTLVFAPAPGVRPSAILKEPIVWMPGSPGKGCHQRDGIILFEGPGVGAQDLGHLSLYDVAPTLLWAMGSGVPRGIDGRVLLEAFDPAFSADRPVNEIEPWPFDDNIDSLDEESGEYTSRLKALGYL
jgi:predicted AlkP superfamily phosphohydrolase/phosphomutase